MTLTVHTADEIRRAVHFTDLIEPMRVASGDYSAGQAQQTMSTLWLAGRQQDADVLVKAGCIAGHDAFVVKIAPWFKSNEIAGQAQGGAYQRDPDAITVASLVGIGVQNVAAAEVALARLATRCAGA